MTLDEKMRIFYDSTIADATEKSNAIIEDYKKTLDAALEEHKATARQKAEATLHSESQKLIQEKNRTLALEHIQFKRQLGEKNALLEEIIFSDVEKKLDNFMKTEEYRKLLEHQILYALKFSGDDEIHIYLNPTDSDKKSLLESRTGAHLLISKIDFIGGTRAVIHEKNILIDSSFLSRLEEQKASFSL